MQLTQPSTWLWGLPPHSLTPASGAPHSPSTSMCSLLIHTRPAALPANLSQTAFLMGINRKPFISFPGGGSDSGRSIASSCYYGDPPGPHCLPPIFPPIPFPPLFPDPYSLLSPSHSSVPASLPPGGADGACSQLICRLEAGKELLGLLGLWGPNLTLLPLRIGPTAPMLSFSSDVFCHSSLG